MNDIIGTILLLFTVYIGFLVPQGILIGLLYLFKRLRPSVIQHKNILIASCTIPHILWSAAMILNDKGKSLANAFYEPILIGLILTTINAFFIIKPPKNKTYWLAFLVIVPLTVYFLFPWLEE